MELIVWLEERGEGWVFVIGGQNPKRTAEKPLSHHKRLTQVIFRLWQTGRYRARPFLGGRFGIALEDR